MKLYTQEQVIEMLNMNVEYNSTYPNADSILPDYTPIELPTDEEIEDIAKDKINLSNDCFGQYDFTSGQQDGFIDGAIWMRDKIGGGNNE